MNTMHDINKLNHLRKKLIEIEENSPKHLDGSEDLEGLVTLRQIMKERQGQNASGNIESYAMLSTSSEADQ